MVTNHSFDLGGINYALAIDIPLRQTVQLERRMRDDIRCMAQALGLIQATIRPNDAGVQTISLVNVVWRREKITPEYPEKTNGRPSAEDAKGLIDAAADILNSYPQFVDVDALMGLLRKGQQ